MEMESMNEISVIIVNWNVREFLLRNLKELFEGNQDVAFEVVVVDNASTDGSVEAIRGHFPQVKLIGNEKNHGFARAVNQGLRTISAGHVLLLNPDMRVEAGALKKIVRFLDAHPKTAIVSGKLIDENGNALHHIRRFPDFFSQLLILTKLARIFPSALNHYLGRDLDLEKEQLVDSARGSFFAISAEARKQIGTFDEGYFIWFEEVDYCKRAKEAGYDIHYVPEIIAHDFIGKSFAKRKAYWKQKQFTASMIHYFKKWHPAWQSMILQMLRPFILFATRLHDAIRN